MGFFQNLFGGDPSYPPLDSKAQSAQRLQVLEGHLSTLAQQTKDRLEVVPTQAKAYVFVGKPPKQFGLAWVDASGLHYLKNYTTEKQLDAKKALKLIEALGSAYEASQAEPRFSYPLGSRTVVVTPCDKLAGEVDRILEKGIA